MQRALYDPVDPQLLGALTADLQFRVNGEVYRFGAERTLRRFMEEPELWCGLLRDPVTGMYCGATEKRKDGCALGY